MPVTIVVGGQFGSEGKGKVAYGIASEGAAASMRVGGVNSGHTAIHDGAALALQQLPVAALLPDGYVILPPGNYISPPHLLREVKLTGLDPSRLFIDPNCVVVGDDDVASESRNPALCAIGSTCSGTGEGVLARVGRANVTLAGSTPELTPFLADTLELARSILNRGGRIVLEGTQGYGLSVLHSRFYPFATSRDTTAAGFLSEAGLSPFDVDEVFLVLRTFPIRVAGPSGPLPDEVDWSYIAAVSGAPPFEERTTVTKNVRRVALFSADTPNRAIAANRPTHIVLNHVDYFDHTCRYTGIVSDHAHERVADIMRRLSAPVTHIGLGPSHMAPIGQPSRRALHFASGRP